ncbi:MAG: CoA transferase [Actinomycetota bacterium]
MTGALSHLRVCDFTGQLAGAGATKWLAAFGAEVIRIEDPVTGGRWDLLRGSPPYKDDRRGIEFGPVFNNHNVNKLGVTIDLRTADGLALVEELVTISDVVTENFAAGVMDRLGLGYDRLRELRPDIVYVSNCGFGHTGPYRSFKSWGPIAQAVSGVTHSAGLPGQEPAGWGYSYLDHVGAHYMAMAVLMALAHRDRTGEGQWVDLSCTEVGASLHGADLLDHTVNGRSLRATGDDDRAPDANRSASPEMAPHGVYRCAGDDAWVAIACRDDLDWRSLKSVIGVEAAALGLSDHRFDGLDGRLADQDGLDAGLGGWCAERSRWEIEADLQAVGVPAAAVRRPGERIDGDIATGSRGLWPMVDHPVIGGIRVDGLPVRLSATPWSIDRAAPTLGQHNRLVIGELLGRTPAALDDLAARGVIGPGPDRRSPNDGSSSTGRAPAPPVVGSTVADLATTHRTPAPPGGPGPLHGLRVVELANPFTAFAGRLLADAGADVILVEPPGGAEQRFHGPFADDRPDPEHSLAWWAENTGKRSVVADLETGPGRRFLRRLAATADLLIEAERPGELAALGIDYPDLTGRPIIGGQGPGHRGAADPPPINADLIHVSITPFGRDEAGGGDDMTDLTILARGGPMWSCGYDDHDLPPVRGRGDQGLRIAGHYAVMAGLTALQARPEVGGQFIDVSMVAAANVTTEFASITWLASGQNVNRQTGRHASTRVSERTQVRCADGRYLNTGMPPRTPREFAALTGWLEELGLADEFDLTAVLALGADYERLTLEMVAEDPLAGEVFHAGRQAIMFIASRLSAHETFVGGQSRGLAVGVIWSADEVLADPHFIERGFPVAVDHPRLDRPVIHAGPPIRFTRSPMAVRGPAPALGEHTEEIERQLD